MTTNFDTTQLPTTSLQNINNIIDNGGMNIWQRGTSFVNPANNVYTADRWRTFGGASATWTISQETSIVDSGGSQSKAMKVLVTATSDPILGMLYYVENWTDYVGKTITLSARVRSTVAGKISCIINDGQQANGAYNTLTNTYETISVSKTIVDIGQNRIYIAIGMVDSVVTPVPLTYYIDNVMMTIGSNVPTFVPTNPALDLTRCRRYFRRLYRDTGTSSIGEVPGGQVFTTTEAYFVLSYADMRTAPTITYPAAGQMFVRAANSSAVTCTAISSAELGATNALIHATVASGLVAGNATILGGSSSTLSFIDVSADL